MHDDGSRLLGLAGLRVTGVQETEGDALDLEVESVARAGCCPHCAGTDLVVKDSEFLHAPIWFSTYEYRGRPYTIVLDAASGEVVRGEIPPPTGGFGEFLRSARRGL